MDLQRTKAPESSPAAFGVVLGVCLDGSGENWCYFNNLQGFGSPVRPAIKLLSFLSFVFLVPV